MHTPDIEDSTAPSNILPSKSQKKKMLMSPLHSPPTLKLAPTSFTGGY